MRNGNVTGQRTILEKRLKPKCPICGRLLGPRHEEYHAKYIATHRKAALAYQQKRRNRGRCIICGANREESAAYCKKHLKQRRVATRKRQDSKPWEAGRPGRIPLFPLAKETGPGVSRSHLISAVELGCLGYPLSSFLLLCSFFSFFLTFSVFHREISRQDRLGTTIANSLDP